MRKGVSCIKRFDFSLLTFNKKPESAGQVWAFFVMNGWLLFLSRLNNVLPKSYIPR